MPNKVGAPKGLRVHWLLAEMPVYGSYFCKNYNVSYDYDTHNYFFFRKCAKISLNNFKFADFYTVVRTSKRCWRVVAHNMETKETIYESFEVSQDVCKWLDSVASLWHNNRPWQDDREYIESQI